MALPNRPEPAAQFERRNPADDEFYELAGTWLRENTRNTKTFSILFNELVAYGFPPQSARREVSALALNVLVVLICAGILWYRWPFDMSDSMIARIIVVLVVWVLAGFVFSRTPAGMGLAPDGAATPPPAVAPSAAKPLPRALLWRNLAFVTLSAGMALGLFAQIGLISHLFSLLVPALGPQWAGLAMGAATAAAIAGRTLVGWLMPAGADRRLVACASYAIQVIGSFAFIAAAGTSVPLLLLGVLLFGVGIGNATSLPPLIAQVEFRAGDVPRVVSLVVASAQAAYAFAPAAFGLIRELSARSVDAHAGPGMLVFAAAALVQVLAIGAFLVGRAR